MTTPRTPDDEPGDDQTLADSYDQPSAPPPPQWLNEGQAGPGQLLPEPPHLPPPPPVPPAPPQAAQDDQTVVDDELDESQRTQVVSRRPQQPADAEATSFIPPGSAAPGAAGAGAPPQPSDEPKTAADAQSTTFIQRGQPAQPAQPTPPQSTPPADMTVAEYMPAPQAPVQPPHQAPAPPPFPYAQEIPGRPPAPPAPPAPQAPAAPEPFPYAQEIPGQTPAPPAPPAPPVHHAPAAPEPFPYAQEIPGVPSPNPSASAPPQGFPYAQQIPGQGQAAHPQAHPAPVAPPPSIDEPWRTPASTKRKGGGRKIMKPLLIGVGGVVVLALVAGGGFYVLNRDGGGGETGSAQLAKSVFPLDPAVRADGRNQDLTDVAAAGSTVVAVGGEYDPDQARGLFLTSSDAGATFQQAKVTGLDGADPASGDVPRLVAGSERGWVAVGARPGGAAVWTSPDGKTWERQPDTVGDAFGPGNQVRQIISTGAGFAAIGDNSAKGDFSDSKPAIWLSPDGQRWEALVGDKVGIPAPALKGKVTIDRAAGSGSALLLATSHTPDPKKPKATLKRVWRSGDGGRTWEPAKVPAPKGARGIVVGGGKSGLLVIREVKDGKKTFGQAYTSTDGQSWTTAGKVEPSGYRQTLQILAADTGYVALVSREQEMLISRSQDGKTWQDGGTLANKAGQVPVGAALAAQQTVLVGRTTGQGDADALLAVWGASGDRLPVDPAKIAGARRTDHNVAAVAAENGRAVAVGSAGGDAALWSTQDGKTWTPGKGEGTAITRPGAQMLMSVTGGKAGWLAVGYDDTVPRKPVVVTSADGTTWQGADGDATFKPNGNAPLSAFAAVSGPAGYVIVGDDGLSANTWFSADLKKWERGKGVGSNALAALPNSNRWMRGVTAGAFGYVAVGGIRDPNAGNAPANRPAVWTSPDGKQWTLQQPQLPGGLPEGFLTHVATKGTTLVATGLATTGTANTPIAYVSADGGKTWSESKPSVPDGANGVEVTGLTATAKGFVLTATKGKPGARDVVSWTSPDGSSWTAESPEGEGLSGGGDQQITGLAVLNDQLLGVGRSAGHEDEQPVLWTRPVP